MTNLPDPGESITVTISGISTTGVVERVSLVEKPVSGPSAVIEFQNGDQLTLPLEVFDDD